MKWLKVSGLVLLAAFVSVSVYPQSLAEVARKEKERRSKNRQDGVSAKQFSETEIFGEDEAQSTDSGEEPVPLEDGPFGVDVPTAPEASRDEPQAEESSQRAREETQWRSRLSNARAQVAEARERKALVDSLHYVPGMTFVDDRGNVVIGSLAELRELVAATDRELVAAEASLADLIEDARRAGVPPGWLR